MDVVFCFLDGVDALPDQKVLVLTRNRNWTCSIPEALGGPPRGEKCFFFPSKVPVVHRNDIIIATMPTLQ